MDVGVQLLRVLFVGWIEQSEEVMIPDYLGIELFVATGLLNSTDQEWFDYKSMLLRSVRHLVTNDALYCGDRGTFAIFCCLNIAKSGSRSTTRCSSWEKTTPNKKYVNFAEPTYRIKRFHGLIESSCL